MINNVNKYPEFHTSIKSFLEGYGKNPEAGTSENIDTVSGDIRIDLPVWFGNIKSKNRVVFIGQEPRDTRKDFNIEKVGNSVFATPFGIEKSYSRYFKLFEPYLNNADTFFLFMDVVKEYEVLNHDDKTVNDKNATDNFLKKSDEEFIKKELDIIEPTIIICLGEKAYKFMKKPLFSTYNVKQITHPAAWGGANKAKEQLQEILSFASGC